MTDTKPMQGLAAYLRCEAGGIFQGHPSHETLMTWAKEVEAALAAPQYVKFVGLDWDGVNPPTFAEYLASREPQPVKQADWKPIETAPKDASRILVCRAIDADGNPMGDSFGLFTQRAAWWEGEGWVVYCGLVHEPVCFFEPTHWMPIPPPPVQP